MDINVISSVRDTSNGCKGAEEIYNSYFDTHHSMKRFIIMAMEGYSSLQNKVAQDRIKKLEEINEKLVEENLHFENGIEVAQDVHDELKERIKELEGELKKYKDAVWIYDKSIHNKAVQQCIEFTIEWWKNEPEKQGKNYYEELEKLKK